MCWHWQTLMEFLETAPEHSEFLPQGPLRAIEEELHASQQRLQEAEAELESTRRQVEEQTAEISRLQEQLSSSSSEGATVALKDLQEELAQEKA